MRKTVLLLVGVALTMVVASGVAWAATIRCPSEAGFTRCVGTLKNDTMIGTDRNDFMRGRAGADILKARGNRDGLVGGKGSDALKGGIDDDFYDYAHNAWGKDTITDASISDNRLRTGNSVSFGSSDPLHTKLTINLTSRAGSPEVRNGNLTGTINWENNAIDIVYVGNLMDDTIEGNAAANDISTTVSFGVDSGEDTIHAGAGNDRIGVADGSGGDTVDCGDGVDEVSFDPGDIISSCEILHEQQP